MALITAGFSEAALRRFGSDYTQADIITFVASVRERSERVSESLDPEVAERVLNVALGDATAQGLSREAKTNARPFCSPASSLTSISMTEALTLSWPM